MNTINGFIGVLHNHELRAMMFSDWASIAQAIIALCALAWVCDRIRELIK